MAFVGACFLAESAVAQLFWSHGRGTIAPARLRVDQTGPRQADPDSRRPEAAAAEPLALGAEAGTRVARASAMANFKYRPWIVLGRGLILAFVPAGIFSGCGSDEDTTAATPIDTTPPPTDPGAGLGSDRPDP